MEVLTPPAPLPPASFCPAALLLPSPPLHFCLGLFFLSLQKEGASSVGKALEHWPQAKDRRPGAPQRVDSAPLPGATAASPSPRSPPAASPPAVSTDPRTVSVTALLLPLRLLNHRCRRSFMSNVLPRASPCLGGGREVACAPAAVSSPSDGSRCTVVHHCPGPGV